jgi:LDH2 family malate/lactate/ureidoglycolate dehydrogenase
MTHTDILLGEDDVRHIGETLFSAAGVAARQRDAVIRNILWNELAGRPNFGLERLPVYFKRLKAGALNPAPNLRTDILSAGAAMIDGDNGFGQYVGEAAMAAAIELAGQSGIGACSARRSNFYGSGAYFVSQACEKGMVAFAVSNSFPKVTAHGGRRAALGTNPFAFGAPGPQDVPVLIDFSTASLAGSTVREYAAAGRALPEGAAIFPNGDWATDPEAIGDAALAPFGGAKGFGVALLVEILAGVVSGAGISHGVGSLYRDFDKAADSGHFFIAIDISRWMPIAEFEQRMALLAQALLDSAGDGAVRLPGAERASQQKYHLKNGILVPRSRLQAINDIAREWGCAEFDFGQA